MVLPRRLPQAFVSRLIVQRAAKATNTSGNILRQDAEPTVASASHHGPRLELSSSVITAIEDSIEVIEGDPRGYPAR